MGTRLASNEHDFYDLLQAENARGNIAKGILETVRLLERRKATLVVVAENVAPPERLDVVLELCKRKGVEIVKVADKGELGKAVGLEVAASCVALRTSMH